jgi:hypothetical protein
MTEAAKKIESPEAIERDFKAKVANELRITSEGIDRFVVSTPISFGDGDSLPIVLKKNDDRWYLTDEAHTFLQLSYRLTDEELEQPARRDVIDHVLSSFEIENRNGELILPIPGSQYGDALYSFVQALLKIDDIRYLSRDRVQSTFLQDLKGYLENVVSSQRIATNWHDPERDKSSNYPVDYRINGMKTPVFIFAINSEHKADISTISLLKFEQWQLNYKSVGIFDEMETFSGRTIARFADACGKTYSNLEVAKESLLRFVPELASSDS